MKQMELSDWDMVTRQNLLPSRQRMDQNKDAVLPEAMNSGLECWQIFDHIIHHY